MCSDKAQELMHKWEQQKLAAHQAIDQGRLVQAEKLWWSALQEAECMESAEMICICLDGVADVFMKSNRTLEAENIYRESLRQKIALHGADHPIIGTAYNSLATAVQSQGRHEEAEACLREALSIFTNSTGLCCPEAQWSAKRLVILLHFLGRHGDATETSKQVLAAPENAQEPCSEKQSSLPEAELPTAVCEVCHRQYRGMQCLRCTQRGIKTLRTLASTDRGIMRLIGFGSCSKQREVR